MTSTVFTHPRYVIKRKFLEFLGQQYRIFDPQENLVLFVKMKAFKLREDIRFFGDEAMMQEILVVKARRIIDFGAAYDVFESATGQRLGTLRRKGIKSMLRDEWAILNFDDQTVGMIQEDSWVLALVRRMVFSLLPQKYHATIGDRQVATFNRHLSLFLMKMTVDIFPGSGEKIDPRMLIASALLLCAVEGRQD